ncbi:MAG TPA: ATP-binding cassette domain-containing protein [Thermoanaerobaculaceae bacterium]|nr:ATP-binding cassette domain-containing protein [Thermoanaerobaculaceae bacterium]
MIEVQGLTKRFVDKDAVADVSFFVPEGEVLGFLGPNGAGKTTTMRMITGYLPPSAGSVRVAGIELAREPLGVRGKIGYLPENVALYPEMRVGEYLSYRAAIEGVPRVHTQARLDEVCERTMIIDVRSQIIGTLSKGYRQRVGLAAALIHQPPVLILDEPTVGLDPRQIVKIRELITELGRDHTVILSTHILPEVEQICRRVLIIDNGKLVADGTPEQLRAGLQGAAELRVQIEASEDDVRAGLTSLPGVTEVESAGSGRFVIAVEGGLDLRRAVFSLAVERSWVLLEMAQTTPSLEDVFLRLTTRDAAGEAPAEAAMPEGEVANA